MSEDSDRWRNLDVWKKADELAYLIYQATFKFPKEEAYGITSQLRRAAISIPTNIVEGYSRHGDKELTEFLSIALGSLGETKYLLSFSRKLGYLGDSEYRGLCKATNELGRRLWRFYERVREG